MLVNLKDKKILVGVTGSIAIYKACELIRLFIKSGANVNVVMSPNAQKFINPITFEALSRNKVLTEVSEDWSNELNHIDLAQKSDAFVIAPATANTINKLSKGIADNILLSCALAYPKNLIIAPSANTEMLNNHYTQGSLKMLKVNDTIIVEPQTKKLVCGVEGSGALAKPLEIYYATAREILKDEFWENRKVVISGGGTREPIDEVRYIGNRSSGKMANALALALYLKGADVCLVTTKKDDSLPSEIYTLEVEDSSEMSEYIKDCIRVAKKGKVTKPSLNNPEAIQVIRKKPYLFMAAAVADFKPKYPQDGKLKKEALGSEWSLELTQTEDILKSIPKEGIIKIGFKAEKDEESAIKNATKAIDSKNLDAIALNILKEKNDFGSDYNEIIFITPNQLRKIPLMPKIDVAFELVELAKELDNE
ncbi:MAG: bifunctional phosphopantothenoylcysteine decarboxylase/phosphopantothenate--cysteine ligase CoaBC [Epsilonproteobacteria bacterium]|nr:bifunctional phosphopantothenoylcysteine decarboxylase/phosphopantothenate--cysteine ligase CoaBC [Campylobacterota bacterium]